MNKPKEKKKEPSTRMKKASGVARSFLQVLNGEFLSMETASRHLPFVFFLAFLLVSYIAYGYYAEKTIRELDQVNRDLVELKTEQAFTNSQLSTRRQETMVRKEVKDMGLRSYNDPPLIIRLQGASEETETND